MVASKFFPIDSGGKQSPLCERDYFRRLNLICAKCGMALRGSYITACSTYLNHSLKIIFLSCFGLDKKFHVEHFTCSLCSTLFGPQDSYYEHDGDVYCHFHYSTRFATKCAGCNSAILKQFVEINRNMRDECWHPECYMINKVGDLFQKLEHSSQLHDLVLECQSLVSQTNEFRFCRWTRRTCLCRRRTARNSGVIERQTSSHGAAGLSHMDVRNLFSFCLLNHPPPILASFLHLKNQAPLVYRTC